MQGINSNFYVLPTDDSTTYKRHNALLHELLILPKIDSRLVLNINAKFPR